MAKQSNHTPGNWELQVLSAGYPGSGPEQIISIRCGETVIAHYGTMSFEYPKDEINAANGRLMAAAPDLLQACKTFAEWLHREETGHLQPWIAQRGTPEGERAWRIWWEENLRICDLAQTQARTAIAKACDA